MIVFIARRVALAVFVVLVVTLLVSWAIRLTGDPAIMLAQGAGSVTEEDLQRIRIALGLDRPFLVQYLGFLKGLVTGDFGRSFLGGTPVSLLVGRALPATLLLAFVSLAASILVSIPLGIHAAVHRGKAVDQLIRILSLVGLSFPNFWLAIMMVLVFSIGLGWLPPSGMEDASSLVMPAATMAVILTATNVRLVRTAMLETLSAQYIMVARSKGLRERVVLYKHALRNCAIPLITYIGLQFGGLVGGIVVVEQVFAWPGMGSLAFDAIAARDYPVLQAVITVLAILIVVINLAVDIAYGLVDPRIRAGVS
ncbi:MULTISPECIES: ABC transporter permease [Inquilinus]|uniref:Peptide/nickel transport system permease protein n=1 Tax=Inquilinus ginsengisoli TaxID=363840 RepID=A0ABU1K0G7_9PROT|nr:ABC transporter permease [Inquilinus ginsengisoli]MDR6294027.1 peptide/nickel transport system permease protein [Inquilinus ginsengisoli]